jgi:predicted RNase H-like HicB family nuclease
MVGASRFFHPGAGIAAATADAVQMKSAGATLTRLADGAISPLMSEIIFEVQEDAADGGFVATALGHAIVTQGETLDEVRAMVRDAVNCHFGDGAAGPMPKIIRLHFVRDEVLAA